MLAAISTRKTTSAASHANALIVLPPTVQVRAIVRRHALPVATAQVLTVDDQTLGQCLLVLDPGTDVELQLSLQGLDLVRGIAEELMKIADAGSPKRPAVN